jgi:hypothetical protein
MAEVLAGQVLGHGLRPGPFFERRSRARSMLRGWTVSPRSRSKSSASWLAFKAASSASALRAPGSHCHKGSVGPRSVQRAGSVLYVISTGHSVEDAVLPQALA